MKKTLLCFGDSNTWGFIPGSVAERYDTSTRYPKRLQALLQGQYDVIEEGLNSRTTCHDDPMNDDKNGRRQLPFLLSSHSPLDVVTLMLGTNDLKHYFNLNEHDIAIGAGKLVDIILTSEAGPNKSAPQVILIAPPLVVESKGPYGHLFDNAIDKSLGFSKAFRNIAEKLKVHFFNAAEVTTPPPTDGVHIDAKGHKQLAETLANFINSNIT